jgi:DedD protein
MENRLKERLTGAAIIVALIVLVVPELFQGRHDAATGGTRGAPDGPVRRSYVIDLKESGAHDAAPPAAAVVAAPEAAVAPTGADTHPVSAATAPPAAASAPTSGLSPPALAPTAPSARATGGNASGWSVQLGLFAQRENAQRLLQAAQSKGFAVRVSGADPNGPYRVHVTGLADRAAAENVRARLRAEGFAAAIVGP